MLKNTCEICGAEMKPLLMPGSFYCPNNCDKIIKVEEKAEEEISYSDCDEQLEIENAWEELKEEYGESLIEELKGDYGNTPDEIREFVEDHYWGCYDSLEAWAEDYINDTGMLDQVPEFLQSYIDLEKYARDAVYSGEIFKIEIDGYVHIFHD